MLETLLSAHQRLDVLVCVSTLLPPTHLHESRVMTSLYGSLTAYKIEVQNNRPQHFTAKGQQKESFKGDIAFVQLTKRENISLTGHKSARAVRTLSGLIMH